MIVRYRLKRATETIRFAKHGCHLCSIIVIPFSKQGAGENMRGVFFESIQKRFDRPHAHRVAADLAVSICKFAENSPPHRVSMNRT